MPFCTKHVWELPPLSWRQAWTTAGLCSLCALARLRPPSLLQPLKGKTKEQSVSQEGDRHSYFLLYLKPSLSLKHSNCERSNWTSTLTEQTQHFCNLAPFVLCLFVNQVFFCYFKEPSVFCLYFVKPSLVFSLIIKPRVLLMNTWALNFPW